MPSCPATPLRSRCLISSSASALLPSCCFHPRLLFSSPAAGYCQLRLFSQAAAAPTCCCPSSPPHQLSPLSTKRSTPLKLLLSSPAAAFLLPSYITLISNCCSSSAMLFLSSPAAVLFSGCLSSSLASYSPAKLLSSSPASLGHPRCGIIRQFN